MYVRKCIEHIWSAQSPPWHIQAISLGIFLVVEEYFALIDVHTFGQETTLLRAKIKPVLKIE